MVEHLPPLCVLVVDDSADAAGSVSVLVRRWGHETRTAGDGPGALKIAWDYRPDAAVLCPGLTCINVCELVHRLRAMPALKDMAIVALTGYGEDEYYRLEREEGLPLYRVKPLNTRELGAVLDMLAAKKAKRRRG